MKEFRSDWFVRDNLEFDEKLPDMAKEVVFKEIDFEQFETKGEVDDDVISSMIEIMIDHLECFETLTSDEVEHFLEVLSIGCRIVVMVNEGTILEEDDGKLTVAEEENIS